jgi:hypothetical protein
MPRGRPEKQAEATTTAPANGKPISKLEAVKRSLAELGNDAKPAKMSGWTKDRLGIDMTAEHISTAKGAILRQAGAKGRRKKPGRRKAASAAPEGTRWQSLTRPGTRKRSTTGWAVLLLSADFPG